MYVRRLEIVKKQVEKPRCSGQWSEAQFITFVKSQLRGASWKWPLTSEVFKAARQSRGWYKCNGCKECVPSTIKGDGGKRINNTYIDHVKPVIDPEVGFTTWDDYINNLYCEKDNLQMLCKKCHDEKTSMERKLSTEARRKKKNG